MKFVSENEGRPNLDLLNPGCPASIKALMEKCWV